MRVRSGTQASKRAAIREMVAKPSHGSPAGIEVDDISGHGVLKSSRATEKSQIGQMTKKIKRSLAKRPLRVTKASDKSNGSFEESPEMQPKHGQESSDRFGGLCIGHGDENNQVAEDHRSSCRGVRAQPQGHYIQQQEGQLILPQEKLAVEENVFTIQDLEVLQCEPQECGPFILEKEAERGGDECCGSASLRYSVAGPLAEQPHPCPQLGKKKSRSGSTKQNTTGETNTSSYSRKRQNAAKCRWKNLASSILLAKNSSNPVSMSETLTESLSLSSENHVSLGQNFSNETERQIRSAESGQSHAIELQPKKRRRTAIARKRSTELKMQKVQTLNMMVSHSPSSDNPQSLGDNFANESDQIRSAESGDSQATKLGRKNGRNVSATSAKQNISAGSGDSQAMGLQLKNGRKVSAASAKRNMQQVQKQQVRILSRMKTFFIEAKFLQTQNEDNDTMDKEAFIMTEDQRQAFAKAMVQSCQKNAKMRKVFLESVRKLTASGLMQAAAAKLLQKGSFEEAQCVMDVWGDFQQKSTLTLPVNLFNAVNQLHERGELAKELRETEELGLGAFHQIDEKAWRFCLPQLPAEEPK